jgi:hypothetical protein
MEAITKEQAVELIAQNSLTDATVASTVQHDSDEQLYEVVSVTPVKLAAKHKEVTINKVSKSTANLPLSSDFYRSKVIESAKALGNEVEEFTVSDTFYEHTDCYPVCKAKRNDTMYLYGIYQTSSKPVFIKDGEELTKEDVAEYLTPAEAKKLLGSNEVKVTENKTNNVTHDVKPRTTKLENIKSIRKV